MKNCVRCGNEIDVFSKNPDKVFYCKKCSLEALKINEDKLFKNDKVEETFVSDGRSFYMLIPGLYQLQKSQFLKGCIYFYCAIFFPIAWFVFLLLTFSSNHISSYDSKPLCFFSGLVLLQYFLIVAINFREVKNGTN